MNVGDIYRKKKDNNDGKFRIVAKSRDIRNPNTEVLVIFKRVGGSEELAQSLTPFLEEYEYAPIETSNVLMVGLLLVGFLAGFMLSGIISNFCWVR